MLYLRIALFLGMVFHKLVWELLKKRDGSASNQRQSQNFSLKSLVKFGKTLVLLFLVIQTLFLDVLPITENPAMLRVIGTIIYTVGLATAVIGRWQLGNNWANLEDYQVLPEQELVQTGIYAYIRHPIYTGDILLVLGLELALNSWLVLGVIGLILVVIRQTLAEERVLSRVFPDYVSYRQQTKMFIPFIV